MTMTTTQYFEKLLDRINLKLDDKERKMIEEKQGSLRDALREALDLKDDFLTGSYPRHTIIKPKKDDEKFDVDVFIAFDSADYGEKALPELRGLVVNALNKIKEEKPDLGITSINDTQRRSVRVEFSNNFRIDVVPSIEIEKDKLYRIFDKRTLRPVKSNPKLHARLLTEANDRTGGKLVPIIKTLKSWRRDKCDYVKSFHLELLAAEVIGGSKIDSYAEGLARFFAGAVPKLRQACLKDPANGESCIDTYLDEDKTRDEIVALVLHEKEISEKAIKLEKGGDDDAAVTQWKTIFDSDGGGGKKGDSERPFSPGPVFISRTPPKPHCNVRLITQE